MRKLLVPSILALTLAATAAVAAEENDPVLESDETLAAELVVTEEEIVTEETMSIDESIVFDDAETAIVYDEYSETAEIDFTDPEVVRAEATALIKLPVVDAEGRKVGVVENVVMTDGQPDLVVVKLDSLIPGGKLLRAVPHTEAVIVDEGYSVSLATLKKADIRKQDVFAYADGMDTIVPVAAPVASASSDTES